uniref:RNase H type-1 domain-containing protein n=1 Tax=Rosa rugosa TaxID=74645 RepID=J7G5A8_ROSRU|nr:hypothetical protein [Rosa rugosa]
MSVHSSHLSPTTQLPTNLRPPRQQSWCPPPLNTVRINTDACWFQSSLSGAIAAIARDSRGAVLGGKAFRILAPSPMAAEALALREAVCLAMDFTLGEVIISSDSKSLIQCLEMRSRAPDWRAATIVEQVRSLTDSRKVSWSWISRSANQAAHLVASLVHRGVCSSDWVQNPPPLSVIFCFLTVLPLLLDEVLFLLFVVFCKGSLSPCLISKVVPFQKKKLLQKPSNVTQQSITRKLR